MNRPPEEFTPVAPDTLAGFVREAFERVGMPPPRADLLARLLVTNDRRGVFSHGTRQALAYVGHFQKGRLTPTAEVTIVSDTPATLVLDGGGGLGYFPCVEAAQRLAPKARSQGVAVATTRNHGHFGAAGIYARMLLEHDLFAFVTSGHQLQLAPGEFVARAAGGSPMAFGIPTEEEPPFVLDFGAMHDLYVGADRMRKVMELAPSAVLRSFGLGCACQALGGLLCGVPLEPERARREWSGADQGSLMIAVDISLLFPLADFKREMDAYARTVRRMEPLPGLETAGLPGYVEWERERRSAAGEGIPVGARHAQALRQLAQDLDLAPPV